MLAFLKLGCNVLTPYGDREPYDFVVDMHGTLLKMQSKTANYKNGVLVIGCRRNKNQWYKPEEVDYIVTSYAGVTYMIPLNECGSEKTLRLEPAKKHGERGICWAKDYEVGEVVQRLAQRNVNKIGEEKYERETN